MLWFVNFVMYMVFGGNIIIVICVLMVFGMDVVGYFVVGLKFVDYFY